MKTSISASISYITDQNTDPITISTRALFAAILSRALKDILKPTNNEYDLHKKQALHWMKVNDPESFTSFVNICNYLDIDVDRMRRDVSIELYRIELRIQSQPSVKIDSR